LNSSSYLIFFFMKIYENLFSCLKFNHEVDISFCYVGFTTFIILYIHVMVLIDITLLNIVDNTSNIQIYILLVCSGSV
jgi:hypothetical protein